MILYKPNPRGPPGLGFEMDTPDRRVPRVVDPRDPMNDFENEQEGGHGSGGEGEGMVMGKGKNQRSRRGWWKKKRGRGRKGSIGSDEGDGPEDPVKKLNQMQENSRQRTADKGDAAEFGAGSLLQTGNERSSLRAQSFNSMDEIISAAAVEPPMTRLNSFGSTTKKEGDFSTDSTTLPTLSTVPILGGGAPASSSETDAPPPPPSGVRAKCKLVGRTLKRHLKFVGPGLVSSVAYFDPGNWTVDLQAGSVYGYKLLFMVLMASLGAVVLQVLSLRLGVVTGVSLAKRIRMSALELRDEHPKIAPFKWRRRGVMVGLYTLYVLCEIAVIATDLAELLGSAIALNLIFPKLPLYAGVLITIADTLFVLAFFQRPDRGRKGMLLFEIIIVALVLAVFISFIILIAKADPVWKDVFIGYLPSKTVFGPGALYISVGIIGATVMPHALFIGSHLGSIDRLDDGEKSPEKQSVFNRISQTLGYGRENEAKADKVEEVEDEGDKDGKTLSKAVSSAGDFQEGIELRSIKSRIRLRRSKPSSPEPDIESHTSIGRLNSIRIHLIHATVDIVASLTGFAFVINSAILILAAAVFYYNSDSSVRSASEEGDLFTAHRLIADQIGDPAAFIFAFALLCCGQSASITATLAGQIISEDFIAWKTNPVYRRLATRLIGAVPSAAVAAAVGREGMNTMLVASQVILSVILPFAIFPLVWLCSRESVMTVHEMGEPTTPQSEEMGVFEDGASRNGDPVVEGSQSQCAAKVNEIQSTTAPMPDEPNPVPNTMTNASSPSLPLPSLTTASQSFVANRWMTGAGYLIFILVTLANAYVLVNLMMGN